MFGFRQLFSSAPRSRFEVFEDHLRHATTLIARRRRRLRSRPDPDASSSNERISSTDEVHVRDTNLPHHLSLMARYLKEEADEIKLSDSRDVATPTTTPTVPSETAPTADMGPCLEHLIHSRFLITLVAFAAGSDDHNDPPKGTLQLTLRTFSLLIRNLPQAPLLIPNVAFGGALMRLLELGVVSADSCGSDVTVDDAGDAGMDAGSLVNGIMRVLEKNPKLIRVFLGQPTPADRNDNDSGGTTTTSSVSVSAVPLFSNVIPGSFRPLEVAIELMGLPGVAGRIGRETVAIALEIVASFKKLFSTDDDDMVIRLYADYVAYLVHHSQISSILSQEMAILYAEIPTSGRSLGATASTTSSEAVNGHSRSPSAKTPRDLLLEYWAFTDSLVLIEVPSLSEVICDTVRTELLQHLILRDLNSTKPLVSATAIGILATILHTTKSERLRSSVLDGINRDESVCLKSITNWLQPADQWEVRFTTMQKALQCLDVITSSGNEKAITVLLGSWSVYSAPLEQCVRHSAIKKAFDGILSVSGLKEDDARSARDLDSCVYRVFHSPKRMPAALPSLRSGYPLEMSCLQQGVLAEPLGALLGKVDELHDSVVTTMAVFFETLMLVCNVEGALALSCHLQEAISRLQRAIPSEPFDDSTTSLSPRQEMHIEETSTQRPPIGAGFLSWLIGSPSNDHYTGNHLHSPTTSTSSELVTTAPSEVQMSIGAEWEISTGPSQISSGQSSPSAAKSRSLQRSLRALRALTVYVAAVFVVRFGAAATNSGMYDDELTDDARQEPDVIRSVSDMRRIGVPRPSASKKKPHVSSKADSGVTIDSMRTSKVEIPEGCEAFWDVGAEVTDLDNYDDVLAADKKDQDRYDSDSDLDW